ncbi:MAG TPA: YciI family protein [Candidatus Polarisedimenticolaceae bacterium]|nr:YciI family protein [Candidatus Polarisedimenticolaceae bacterium]
MSDEPEVERYLDPVRRELARRLPPAELESRVVFAVRNARRRRRGWRWAAAVLAGSALFGAGWISGASGLDPRAKTAPDGKYALLLFSIDDRPGADANGRVREYAEWARRQRDLGRVLDGHKLADEGRTLNSGSSTRLSGYFVVAAPDLDTALEIAKSCPHAAHGGRIEVRAIER